MSWFLLGASLMVNVVLFSSYAVSIRRYEQKIKELEKR